MRTTEPQTDVGCDYSRQLVFASRDPASQCLFQAFQGGLGECLLLVRHEDGNLQRGTWKKLRNFWRGGDGRHGCLRVMCSCCQSLGLSPPPVVVNSQSIKVRSDVDEMSTRRKRQSFGVPQPRPPLAHLEVSLKQSVRKAQLPPTVARDIVRCSHCRGTHNDLSVHRVMSDCRTGADRLLRSSCGCGWCRFHPSPARDTPSPD
jgi:hypothetical protein